jgi:hypothetical protein
MSRKKRKLESFDVVDFLRESDDDLKSALNSLLRSPVSGLDQAPEEGLGVAPQPGAQAGLRSSLIASVEEDERVEEGSDQLSSFNLTPGIELRRPSIQEPEVPVEWPQRTTSWLNLIPGIDISDSPGSSSQDDDKVNLINAEDESDDNSAPGINLIYRHSEDSPEETSTPGLKLTPPPSPGGARKRRQFPIREVRLAQDAHTRAEQQVYEALWENSKVLDDVSKTITIGFGAMARMVRLSESNARINVRNLIAKLAMEEMGTYNCEYAIGRRYRIFNYSEIQRRRREAGLTWYMRRTLAVVFVDPVTKEPIDLGARKRIRQEYLNSGPGLNLIPDPGPNLGPPPGPKLGPLTIFSKEEFREELLRETSSSSIYEALSVYGTVDDDVVTRLRAATGKACADYTDAELVHFIHAKGVLLQRPDTRISSPIGFLLTAVPKCFVGEAFHAFRRSQAEAENRQFEERDRQMAEVQAWKESQQAILDDPASSEEEKRWARKWLEAGTAGA